MRCRRTSVGLVVALLVFGGLSPGRGASGEWGPAARTALEAVARRADMLQQVNRLIWEFAEIGLEEKRSSGLLMDKLRAAGFEVQAGVAGMPTAFVASYGDGRPVIGILAEYDALPGMSQEAAPRRSPLHPGAPGHACGHCALGAGSLGAALAVKEAIERHKLSGTVRLYGTPAEETVIGKVYMTLAGCFDDLDACLHWHPGDRNEPWAGSSKALVSARFTFTGVAAHASVSPERGRSALDAVELMNVGANYMREHLTEDARLHYVITDGGQAPNVTPPKAAVWYFVRADSHDDVERNFRWLQDVARGAAMMTQTDVQVRVETDCHELIPNGPLTELILRNMRRIGTPRFTDAERELARRLQAPLEKQFGMTFPMALDERIHEPADPPAPSKGSTDVGDVSWRTPTGGLRAACFPVDSPGHSWQNAACITTSIGQKGMLYAARTLAVTAVDLLGDPDLVKAARRDWRRRLEGRRYFSFIPKGQEPPRSIRQIR